MENKDNNSVIMLCWWASVKHWLDPSREARHWEEKAIRVEVLKHALNWLAIDSEGDTGHTEVQAAAHHIFWSKEMLIGWANSPRNAACTGYTEVQRELV